MCFTRDGVALILPFDWLSLLHPATIMKVDLEVLIRILKGYVTHRRRKQLLTQLFNVVFLS